MGNKSSRHGQRRTAKKGPQKRSVTEHDDSYNGSVRVRALGVEMGVSQEATDYSPAEGQSERAEVQSVNKEGLEPLEEPQEEARAHNGEDADDATPGFHEPSTGHCHVRSGEGADTPEQQQRSLLPRPAQTVVELRIALHSQATEEVKIRTLENVPPNVEALKKHVQCNYNVPTSGQAVLFDSVPLRDQKTLPLHYMRTGDTIDIHFLSEVDMECISSVLNTLNCTATHLDSLVPHLCHATGTQMQLSMQQLQEIETLSHDYFFTSSDELSKANFLFFCENGGPESLFQVHRHLLTHPWEGLCVELKLLEGVCLYLCWTLTELCAAYNMPHIQHSLVDILTRITSEARAKWCPVCRSLAVGQEEDIKIAKYKALSALSNLIESVPSCRVQIASDETLTAHLVRPIATRVLNDALDYKILRVVLNAFMSLAYSPETHQYLVKPHIIDSVMTAPTKQSEGNFNHSWYMATVFLALVVANPSARCMIPNGQLKSIRTNMNDFLNSVKLDELNKYEEELGIYWVTMLPHVRVAYTPLPPATSNGVSPQQDNQEHGEQQDENELVLLCIEVAIVSIHVMNLNPENKDVLMKEGLLDFVQCLPWHMPPESKAAHRALQLVTKLKAILAHPPTLKNIARAKLASMHFGLDAVLHKHIHELTTELYSSTV